MEHGFPLADAYTALPARSAAWSCNGAPPTCAQRGCQCGLRTVRDILAQGTFYAPASKRYGAGVQALRRWRARHL